MSATLNTNFNVQVPGPIDTRMVTDNATTRAQISAATNSRYDGMKVFQLSDRQTYTWNETTKTWAVDSVGTLSGGGTAGFIPTFTSSSSIANSMLFTSVKGTVDGNNAGFVGLNNVNPQETLQINSPFTGANIAPPVVIHKGGSSVIGENWYYTTSEQYFDLTKGSTILQFDGNSLSIKARNPNSNATTYNKLKVTATDLELSSFIPPDGSTVPNGTIMASIVARSLTYGANLASIKFIADGSFSGGIYPTSIVFYGMSGASLNRAMTVKPNGSVIVGATSGTVTYGERLWVEGDVRVQNVINFGAFNTPTYSRTGYIWAAPTFLQINRQTNHPINFATNNVDRMTISETGNVGINTGSSTLFAKLTVSNYNQENFEFSPGVTGSFNGGVIQYINRLSGSTRNNMNYYLASGNNTGGNHRFWTNGVERMVIRGDGKVLIGATTSATNITGLYIGTDVMINVVPVGLGTTLRLNEGFQVVRDSSARAYKKDITTLDYGLNEILNLNPVRYKWKSDSKDDIGFVADEVVSIVPEIVQRANNSNGDTGLPDGEPMSINYERLTAILTKAIQEQQSQINELKAEIEKLKK